MCWPSLPFALNTNWVVWAHGQTFMSALVIVIVSRPGHCNMYYLFCAEVSMMTGCKSSWTDLQTLTNETSAFSKALPPKPRYIGAAHHGSEVITGVFVHQTRLSTAADCSFKFSKLQIACTVDPILAAMSDNLGRTALDSFGRDPVFNPLSKSYVAELEGSVGDFYNSSQGSGEVAPTGYPYAFFVRPVAGIKELGFTVVFEVRHCHRYSSEDLKLGPARAQQGRSKGPARGKQGCSKGAAKGQQGCTADGLTVTYVGWASVNPPIAVQKCCGASHRASLQCHWNHGIWS
jgi:hypothetical protein